MRRNWQRFNPALRLSRREKLDAKKHSNPTPMKSRPPRAKLTKRSPARGKMYVGLRRVTVPHPPTGGIRTITVGVLYYPTKFRRGGYS